MQNNLDNILWKREVSTPSSSLKPALANALLWGAARAVVPAEEDTACGRGEPAQH